MVRLTPTGRKRTGQLAALLLADLVFFGVTNARSVAAFLMIVGLILLVATVYAVIYGLVAVAKLYGLPIKQHRRLTLWLTGAVGLLLALQSISELGAHDVLVLLPLALIGYMYSNYARAARRNIDG